MGVTLERVQSKFACIIGELCTEPDILSQFAIWLDLRLAEYKLKGSIKLDCSGHEPDPTWLRGHRGKQNGKRSGEITDVPPLYQPIDDWNQDNSEFQQNQLHGPSRNAGKRSRFVLHDKNFERSTDSQEEDLIPFNVYENVAYKQTASDLDEPSTKFPRFESESNDVPSEKLRLTAFQSDSELNTTIEKTDLGSLDSQTSDFNLTPDVKTSVKTELLGSDVSFSDVNIPQNSSFSDSFTGSSTILPESTSKSFAETATSTEKHGRLATPKVCPDCGLVYYRHDSFRRHRRIHHVDMKRHICSECGKEFTRNEHLRRHKKTHETTLIKVSVSEDFNSAAINSIDQLT